MDSTLDFFLAYVLRGRQVNRSPPPPPPPLPPPPPHSTGTPSTRSQATALNSGGELFELIQRIHSLHGKARRDSSVSARSISQAVQIWHELDHWDPEEAGPSPELCRLYASYRSALFIWVYFVIYPNDMDGWKLQDALQDILSNISGVETQDLAPLAIIPLFFGGLAATQPVDRESIKQQYERVRRYSQHESLRVSWGHVQGGWGKYDRGIEASRDWI
ncbi:hypothetical protein P175DRAFT_0534595 [Aspergillus ochraceoroseus IBT 24754]|uniref:Uncharacterized protein n=1 Tax=Aspergillus ochraceoroseus IBT 24754 TaxID=1392256 RepID=A0A2T5LRB0_9EURO|nr:uncharacterized protein P175DRAFT_0534595 [Aspergillus ochraceoroseus IBT 24754]PTU18820.1 hypothetical protein P175DRAFT_0534595 [Aspergillus ochraceoroseus IBT 24754]